MRRSVRAGRATGADPETGEQAERGRFVQLRLRERGRHVQDRDQVPDGRGVRQVRVRGRDGQAADGRVRRVGQGLRAGGHRHHRAAAGAGRRLQRPARGPAAVLIVGHVPGRLRRRPVPRGSQRVLQIGTAATGTAPGAGGEAAAATAAAVVRRRPAENPHRHQAVPGSSVRAKLRSRVRILLHLVHGIVWPASGSKTEIRESRGGGGSKY